MGYKYIFRWRKNGDEVILPIIESRKQKKAVKIQKAYSRDYGFKSHLVCPNCYKNDTLAFSELKQYYICSHCKNKYTMQDLPYRQDEKTGIIYIEKQKREYLENELGKEINIEEEINLQELIFHTLFFEEHFEIYSEDEGYARVLKAIYKYCMANKKALLGTIAYRQQLRGCLIYPANNRLILTLLRDSRLIKQPMMEMDEIILNETTRKLEAYSKNKVADKYMEFLDKVKEGKEIIEVKEKKEEEVKIPAWLEAVA